MDALLDQLGLQARKAARTLATASEAQRNQALIAAAARIGEHTEAILAANAEDMDAARQAGKPAAYLDRLKLTPERVAAIKDAVAAIGALPDPVGRVLAHIDRPNGLKIDRIAVPLGVIGMIFEARPNVAADASALCIKSGNAVILRAGSDSLASSRALVNAMREGLAAAGLPEDAVQLIDTTDRAAVQALLQCTAHVDLVIPRGGRGLVELVRDQARVPTLLHLDGNCHTYIHAAADIGKAVAIVRNAKLRRTGICGATESLVVDRSVAQSVLPQILDAMPECEFRGDALACGIDARVRPAIDADFDTEYLDAILSVKIVEGLESAIDWVCTHSSAHTDAIITEDEIAAHAFLTRIDSAIVMHNASTQFADGGEFGMGAEIGIATGKMHARGPVGLEQLTSFKYVVRGEGQTRA